MQVLKEGRKHITLKLTRVEAALISVIIGQSAYLDAESVLYKPWYTLSEYADKEWSAALHHIGSEGEIHIETLLAMEEAARGA